MAHNYWFLLAIDYFLLDLFAWVTINNFDLAQNSFMPRIYHPIYSELFSAESMMLLMVVAGAVMASLANRETDSREVSPLPGHLALLFAVAAVPMQMMTRNLIDYDTLYYAFIVFFSTILLYCFIRNCLQFYPGPGFMEMAAVVAVLTIFFGVAEPWNSPSRKIFKAAEAGDATEFAALALKYPTQLRMHRGVLNAALARPDFAIIRAIVDAGNTSLGSSYMNLEIFAPENLQILQYMHAKGVKLANGEMLRNAVSYEVKMAKDHQDSARNGYPVLKFMIGLYKAAPEEERNYQNVFSSVSGYKSLVSLPAVAGNTGLMNFLVSEGFAVDEEVFQALALNQHLDKPEVREFLQKNPLREARPAEVASASQDLQSPGPVEQKQLIAAGGKAAELPVLTASVSADLPATFAAAPGASLTMPVQQSANNQAGGDGFSLPGAIEGEKQELQAELPREASISAVVASGQEPVDSWLAPSEDGFDLILAVGGDVKNYRSRRENLFHFLAFYWRGREKDNYFNRYDFGVLFKVAVQRQIDINQRNIDGLSPLWVALQANNFRSFVSFVDAGGDLSALDPDGLTMREYCVKNNRRVLLGLIEEALPHEK